MNTIDWSKAPEGATHYSNNYWYRKSATGWDWYYFVEESWLPTSSITEEILTRRLTPRPAEWRGPQDGLPPVGTEIEVRVGVLWKKGTVVALVQEAGHGDMAIIQCEGFWAASDVRGIRPIQTGRDRAVEEMYAAIPGEEKASIEWQAHAGRIVAALVDSGYRKENPPCSTK